MITGNSVWSMAGPIKPRLCRRCENGSRVNREFVLSGWSRISGFRKTPITRWSWRPAILSRASITTICWRRLPSMSWPARSATFRTRIFFTATKIDGARKANGTRRISNLNGVPSFSTPSMYIGHLTAYRRALVDQIGGFRKEFDLSQDYDFALRATERARAIHHIPHILYHWREHPASGSAGGKPEARKSNLAALAEAMRRRNLPAEIIEYPTANRARLKVPSWPRVSVIVPTDSPTRAKACLRDLPRRTSIRTLRS